MIKTESAKSRRPAQRLIDEKPLCCDCPLFDESCCGSKKKNVKIQITYIHQTGKANIAGGGSMQYKGKDNQISADLEDLRKGYKILAEVMEMLKLHDK